MKNTTMSLLSLLLLMTLTGCGKEQFGGTPKSESTEASSLTQYQQSGCSDRTLIKPKVDILYMVDNSSSNTYISSSIKTSIQQTISKVSSQFDYRLIGTGILPVDGSPNDDFQFITNSSDAFDTGISGKRVMSASEMSFFSQAPVSGGKTEAGLRRSAEFITANQGSALFRSKAYLLIVLISNGRDVEIEPYKSGFGTGEQENYTNVFEQRYNTLKNLKTSLQSEQMRMIAVTAHSANTCPSGYIPSLNSYVKMANRLYGESQATDSPSSRDAYDLCTENVTTIFDKVNSAITQVILGHTYKYWPITFTDSDNIDISKIKVYVSAGPGQANTVMDPSTWTYFSNANRSAINTKTSPLPAGEPTTARHLVQFTAGNEIVYPKCVTVTSTSKTEYFGFIVLPTEPKPETIVVRINGITIPASSTNGWTYTGTQTRNIKVAYPAAGDELPAIQKSGFMIQLNGSGNYYKSGDKVDTYFVGAGI